MSFNKFLQISILLLFFTLIPLGTKAVVLYLAPSQGQYYQGDIFIVETRIDTEGECINTVKVDLSFSKDILEVVDFSTGNSILSIWLESPKINQEEGKISFTGGIPGGYCGVLPGELGKPNLLGRIAFQVRETAPNRTQNYAKVEFLESSQGLLNDGLGTPAKLNFKNAVLTILPEKREEPLNEWETILIRDTLPPEQFEIKLNRDKSILEGKYFIVFQAQDKQSGIDYYEVKEGEADWQRASSPYLLKNQRLGIIIKVKAVDKAGNERIVEYVPPIKPFPYWIIPLILLGGGAVIILIITKIRKKEETDRN
ncbi:MAG: hypothetical protein ACPLW9_00490 [Minisyncoccales bacterium]